MDKAEIVKLREFLRRSFGAPAMQVAPSSKSAEDGRRVARRAQARRDHRRRRGRRPLVLLRNEGPGRARGPAGLSAQAVRERQADGRRADEENRLGRTQQRSRFPRRSVRRRSARDRVSRCRWRSSTSISTTSESGSGPRVRPRGSTRCRIYSLEDRHPSAAARRTLLDRARRDPDRRRQAWRGRRHLVRRGPARATTSRSSSARGRTSRSSARCTPTWALRWISARTARSATTRSCMAARSATAR